MTLVWFLVAMVGAFVAGCVAWYWWGAAWYRMWSGVGVQRSYRVWCLAEQVVDACRAGNPRRARRLAACAARVDPDNPLAWQALGHAHKGLGQREQAIECYRRALRCEQDQDPGSVPGLASYFVAECSYELAVLSMELALATPLQDQQERHRKDALAWLVQALREEPGLSDTAQSEPAFRSIQDEITVIHNKQNPPRAAWLQP